MTSAGHPEYWVAAVPYNPFSCCGCTTPCGGESEKIQLAEAAGAAENFQRQHDRAPAQIGERPRPSSVRSISRSA